MIDLAGVLIFLLPFCVLIWVTAWPYVLASWRIHEGFTRGRRATRHLSAQDLHADLCRTAGGAGRVDGGASAC